MMNRQKEIVRRTFLEAAALGAVTASMGLWPDAEAGAQAVPSAAERATLKTVTDFCDAWASKDFAKILPFLADDAVYRMSETTPAVTGHAGVRDRLGSWLESSDRIEFKILSSSVKGPIVINHRIDSFVSTKRPLTWEGVGVFFVKDGTIKEWSDYTIRVTRPPA
jgi:limonene-1,2-epoxide hydrolase